jgi:hypothetical protein
MRQPKLCFVAAVSDRRMNHIVRRSETVATENLRADYSAKLSCFSADAAAVTPANFFTRSSSLAM